MNARRLLWAIQIVQCDGQWLVDKSLLPHGVWHIQGRWSDTMLKASMPSLLTDSAILTAIVATAGVS